jgi:hypothetical protein
VHSAVVLVARGWWGAEDGGVFAGGGLVPEASMFEVRLLGPVQAVRVGREVPLGGLICPEHSGQRICG